MIGGNLMLAFLSHNGGTILLTIALVAVVAAIVRHLIRQKQQGISSCGCGCEGCSGHCHSKS